MAVDVNLPSPAPLSDPPGHPGDPDRLRPLPGWFGRPLTVLLIGVLTFLVVGVLTAMAGWFHPEVVLPLTTAATGVLAWRVLPTLPSGVVPASTHFWSVLVVLGAVVIGGWNVRHHAEHLVIERDPAVYLTTARWLSEEGSLWVDEPHELFVSDPAYRTESPGFSRQDDGRVSAQFPHGLAVVVAGAGWMSDWLLFAANPFLASVSILTVFAVGATVARPFWAAAAAGAWAVSFPFVYFARDVYSEPLTSILVFGGLWLLAVLRPYRWSGGVVVGGLFGVMAAVRIDAYVVYVPLAVVAGAWIRHASRSGDRDRVRWLLLMSSAAAATAILGYLDTSIFSPSYYTSDLSGRIVPMTAAIAAGFVASFALVPLAYDISGPRWIHSRSVPVATALAGTGILCMLTWMALVRPSTDGLPVLASDATGPLLDLLDRAGSLSYRWLEWYLGRPATALGFLGLLGLMAMATLRSRSAAALALPGVVLITTLLYLIAPNITPDQPWAMRRFAAIALPGLLLGAMWLIGHLWEARPSGLPVGPASAVVLLAVCVVPIVVTTRPLRGVQVGRSTYPVIEELCELTDEEPAAVLVADGALLNLTLPTAVATWCDVPAAGVATEVSDTDVESLAEEWANRDRRLVVLSVAPDPWDGVLGVSRPLGTISASAPEVTVTRKPTRYAPDQRIIKTPGSTMTLYATVVQVNR